MPKPTEKCICHAHYDSLEKRADGEKIEIQPLDKDCPYHFPEPSIEEQIIKELAHELHRDSELLSEEEFIDIIDDAFKSVLHSRSLLLQERLDDLVIEKAEKGANDFILRGIGNAKDCITEIMEQ